MTGTVLNLRLARKAKRRADADRTAQANRAAFGRSKVEQDQSQADQALRERQLDLHRRDDT